MLDDKPVIDHVLDACRGSSKYTNRHTHRTGIKTQVHLLVPYGDSRINTHRPGVNIIEGDEDDVLSRYVKMQQDSPGSYIVRITADCPLVKSALISKAIIIAVKGGYDFISNTIPGFRTFYDGNDVEVISAKLLDWLDRNAKGVQREHIMSLLWTNTPPWASLGHIFNKTDDSDIKLSIDKPKDLENVEKHYKSVKSKTKQWSDRYGPHSCHQF